MNYMERIKADVTTWEGGTLKHSKCPQYRQMASEKKCGLSRTSCSAEVVTVPKHECPQFHSLSKASGLSPVLFHSPLSI
jgi:hypothetical protein